MRDEESGDNTLGVHSGYDSSSTFGDNEIEMEEIRKGPTPLSTSFLNKEPVRMRRFSSASTTTHEPKSFGFCIFLVLLAFGLTTGSVFGWMAFADSKKELDREYEKFHDKCVGQFDYNCKDQNLLPKEVGKDYFDQDTGVIISDVLKLFVARGDCKIVNKKVEHPEEIIDFCVSYQTRERNKSNCIAILYPVIGLLALLLITCLSWRGILIYTFE